MDLIDVLDTAVKIGLGALISAVASHQLAKNSFSRELRKLAYVRRQDTLQSVADIADKHFATWRNLISGISGIFKGRSPPKPEFSPEHWATIAERDKAFVQGAHRMAEVISLLQLIGAEDVLVVCEEYTDLISNFRDQMVLQRRTPTEDELEEVSAKVNTAIERFYRELSKVYVSIPNA